MFSPRKRARISYYMSNLISTFHCSVTLTTVALLLPMTTFWLACLFTPDVASAFSLSTIVSVPDVSLYRSKTGPLSVSLVPFTRVQILLICSAKAFLYTSRSLYLYSKGANTISFELLRSIDRILFVLQISGKGHLDAFRLYNSLPVPCIVANHRLYQA